MFAKAQRRLLKRLGESLTLVLPDNRTQTIRALSVSVDQFGMIKRNGNQHRGGMKEVDNTRCYQIDKSLLPVPLKDITLRIAGQDYAITDHYPVDDNTLECLLTPTLETTHDGNDWSRN